MSSRPKAGTPAQVGRKPGIGEQTYYRRRREYGGPRVDQAGKLKELERENARLKRVVADQALDIAILKEAASGNLRARPGDDELSSRSQVEGWRVNHWRFERLWRREGLKVPKKQP